MALTGSADDSTEVHVVSTGSLLVFVAATVPLVLFPGPSVAFILATTLRGGRRAGLSATAGVETGYLVHVLGAVLGVSALLAASAAAFSVVKVAGAAWLVWLAIKAWRTTATGTLADLGHEGVATSTTVLTGRRAFTRGLLVGALNPKTAVFFLAFLPQFIDPGAGPVWIQLLVFGLAFIALASVPDTCWAVLGAGLGAVLPAVRVKVIDRISGGLYAALAAITLTARRAATT